MTLLFNNLVMVKKICLFLVFGLILGCEELIEVEDISNEMVSILAPANDLTIDTTSVNFSWQPINFAESYQFQIAMPNFDTAQIIVEDTIISSTSFIKTLDAANYQWRIKAINSAYETEYTTQNLTIEE